MSYANGPRIVTDGLVLCLDVANSKSYPGTGTSWYDLCGRVNATLVNSPVYSSEGNGALDFDGSTNYVTAGDFTDYFTAGTVSHSLTVCIWSKTSQANGIVIGAQNVSNQRLYIGVLSGLWDCGWGGSQWGVGNTGTNAANTEDWTHAVLSIASGVATLFINGVPTIYKTDTTVSLSDTFPIGAYFNTNSYLPGTSSACSVAHVCVYNRTLSTPEVLQNYNANRGRFDL